MQKKNKKFRKHIEPLRNAFIQFTDELSRPIIADRKLKITFDKHFTPSVICKYDWYTKSTLQTYSRELGKYDQQLSSAKSSTYILKRKSKVVECLKKLFAFDHMNKSTDISYCDERFKCLMEKIESL